MRIFLPVVAVSLFFAVILGIIASNYQQTPEEQAGQAAENQANAGGGEIPAFMNSCLGCHGNDLRGGVGPSLRQLNLSKEEIVEVLKNGRPPNMPGGLIPGQEEKAADYLLSIQE
ncbi:cytochrome c-551 [Bacillaceae bacterium]